MLKKLDQKLFFKLYNFTSSQQKFKKTVVFLTKCSAKFFGVIYLAAVIYLVYSGDQRLKQFILLPGSVYLLLKIIPYLYNRKRPLVSLGVKTLIKQRNDNSFPSNHAASSLIISLVFLNINFQLGLILILISILTALSRIMVGVHYPSDILGAWFLAISSYFWGVFIFF